MSFLHAIPALPVRDTAASAAFYRDKLGFVVRHEASGFAILVRDTVELHLWQAGDNAWQGRGGAPVQSGAESFLAGTASCRVQVAGVDTLHAELQPLGILHPNARLADQAWGTREFGVLDPDGNLITFFERAGSSDAGGAQPPEALYRQLLDAWNRRSAAGYAAPIAEDGNLVGFDGSQIDGRAAIEAEIGQIFADHQTARYIGKVREVRLLAPDVALVRAVVGMVPPGQAEINPAVNAIQSVVAVRDAGVWRVALFQNTPAQFHGRPELAQQLTDELSEELRTKNREPA
jgi:uncharacterized protein (TIGR02246 family)